MRLESNSFLVTLVLSLVFKQKIYLRRVFQNAHLRVFMVISKEMMRMMLPRDLELKTRKNFLPKTSEE